MNTRTFLKALAIVATIPASAIAKVFEKPKDTPFTFGDATIFTVGDEAPDVTPKWYVDGSIDSLIASSGCGHLGYWRDGCSTRDLVVIDSKPTNTEKNKVCKE